MSSHAESGVRSRPDAHKIIDGVRRFRIIELEETDNSFVAAFEAGLNDLFLRELARFSRRRSVCAAGLCLSCDTYSSAHDQPQPGWDDS